MPLVNLLKRKLDRLNTDPRKQQKDADDKKKLQEITPETIKELKAKNTRTARRKLRFAQAQLKEQQQQQKAQQLEEEQNGDFDDGFDIPQGAVVASGKAYDQLLSSLQTSNEALAAAYHQRQKELAGDSEESDADVEEDEEEEQLDSEEEEEADADSDDDQEQLEEEKVDQADAAVDSDVIPQSDSDEKESDPEPEQPRSIKKAKSIAAAKNKKEDDNTAYDCFEQHFSRELTEAELAASRSGGTTKYIDLPANHPLSAWPDTTVQVAVSSQSSEDVFNHGNTSALPKSLAAYGVKDRLITRWHEVAVDTSNASESDFLNKQQQALFAALSSYKDIYHTNRPYPESAQEPDPALDAVLLHILSHIAKTADKIKKNNDQLKQQDKDAAEEPPRDQGFTRPKALILLPQRNIALRLTTRLMKLAIKETRTDSIKHKQRFLEEFGEDEEDLAAQSKALSRKPPQHATLFTGNMDDHFRIGIKLTRGSIRLYTDFFQSDIIIASPLAIATKLGEAKKDGEGSMDFLSSIEILVLDRTDVMLMQNWSHVVTTVNAMNAMPKAQHDTDIMRVREWCLSGRAASYRQTIMMGSLVSPELNALFSRTCVNYAGKMRLWPQYSGVLGDVVPQARQVFDRLNFSGVKAADGHSEPDARFEHFKTKIWPRIREAAHGGGQLLYVPSYFDFVRVRNFLKQEAASFLALSEYSERPDAARARSYFADGRKRVLIYTERAQFYNRHRIRGIKDLYFYQLPEHPQFYSEMVNLLEESTSAPGMDLPTVNVLFSKMDVLRLSRVVGSKRAGKMLKKSSGNTFLFC